MKSKTRMNILFITQAAVIAALYVVLTHLANLIGLASGAIQFRISEALCILSFFTPAAIPGLTIGCFLANLTTGCIWMDILFGTLATFLGTIGGYFLREISVWLVPVPTVLANAVIVPFVLKYGYLSEAIWGLNWYFGFSLSVGIGEVVVAFAGGMILYFAARKPLEKVLFLK